MDVEQLIEEIDIVDYISQFVDLEQKGEEFWGLSPFKDERTPSFSVRKETNSWYDFSSGLGGNVFTFVKFYNDCPANTAVEILNNYVGCTGTERPVRAKISATTICKQFSKRKSNQKTNAGILLPDNCMEQYEKRDDKLSVWKSEGISDESLKKFQVAYDSFSNRLVYPIRDTSGRIVNIGGRTLDNNWKEKGLRKYTYFYQWGTLSTLYGFAENFDSIKEKNEIILFEGCKSVLIADSWGIHNTAAILTSHINPAQTKILISLGCNVVFALDKDVRVRDDRNINKLRHYVNVSYIYDYNDWLSEKDSPVDKGQEVFERLYNERLYL